MGYEELIKEFKKELMMMDIKDEDLIKNFNVSHNFKASEVGMEEVTVTITYYRTPEKPGSRRWFNKPIPPVPRPRPTVAEIPIALDLTTTGTDSSGNFTFTQGSTATVI